MDADLQHPPEKVPELLKSLRDDGNDFVIGTRYAKGCEIDKDWPLHRRIISEGARLLARPLSPLSDPMSGFFGVKREVWEAHREKISAVGFKIALETFVKAGCQRYGEVAINFGTRIHGESKLTGSVMLKYVQHLAQLYRFRFPFLLMFLVILFCFMFFVLVRMLLLL